LDIGELSPAAVAGPPCDPIVLSQMTELAAELEALGYPVGALLGGPYELFNTCLDAWIGQFGRADQPKPPREGAWKQVHTERQSALIKLLRLQAGLQQCEAGRRPLAA